MCQTRVTMRSSASKGEEASAHAIAAAREDDYTHRYYRPGTTAERLGPVGQSEEVEDSEWATSAWRRPLRMCRTRETVLSWCRCRT